MRPYVVRDLVAAEKLRVEDGNHGNDRPRPDEFVDAGVTFVRAADMTSGVVDFAGAGKISEVAYRRIRKGVGAPGDVILSHKGTVGRVAIAPEGAPDFVCSPQTTFWRSLDPGLIDQRFLGYVLRSRDVQSQIVALANKTDMAPYVSLTDQRSIRITVPPVGEQRAVSEVLGALDEKIAVNGRAMRALCDFADVRYGRVAALSAISDRFTFADVADIGGGGTPRTSVKEFWGGAVRWATPKDLTGLTAPYLSETSRSITAAGLAACSSELYPVGSILMTSRATIGAFAVAQSPVAVNQGFIVVNAKHPRHQWWLYHNMRSRTDEFLAFANGATFLELPRGRFRSLLIDLPEDSILDDFNRIVQPLHASAANILLESKRLKNTLEELLPLLMSGRVRIKDADRVVERVL